MLNATTAAESTAAGSGSKAKAVSAGKTKITGTYKMSVCSADQCQIEEPSLELVIPAS